MQQKIKRSTAILSILLVAWLIYLVFQFFTRELMTPGLIIQLSTAALSLLFCLATWFITLNNRNVRFSIILLAIQLLSTLYFTLKPSALSDLIPAFIAINALVSLGLIMDIVDGKGLLERVIRLLIVLFGLTFVFGTIFHLDWIEFYNVLLFILILLSALTIFSVVYRLFTSRK